MSSESPSQRKPWGKRLLWLLAIWAASVAALGLVAFLLRGIMGWVGLTAP